MSKNYAIAISGKDNIVFAIEHDGTMWYTKDGVLTKFEDEKEMVIMLLAIISGRYGDVYNTKEELFIAISKAHRDGKIKSILGN